MPSLGSMVLPYLESGLSKVRGGAGGALSAMGSSKGLYKALSFMGRNRTAVGAGLGAAFGAYRGDDYSASRMAGYAALGAGVGRYGTVFGKSLVQHGVFGNAGGMGMAGRALGVYGAASRAGGFMANDARRASRFIGATAMRANRGMGKIPALRLSRMKAKNAAFGFGMGVLSRAL